MACSHCGIWRKKSENELNAGEILEFFSLNRGFRLIDITGGEPFLRDDLGEIFEIILNSQPRLALLHFPTNGWHTCRSVECSKAIKGKSAALKKTIALRGIPLTSMKILEY